MTSTSKPWEEKFDSMFDWADQVKERELGHWRIMYGFLPEDLKSFIRIQIKAAEKRTEGRILTEVESLRFERYSADDFEQSVHDKTKRRYATLKPGN